MYALNYQGFVSLRYYWSYQSFIDRVIVIRTVETEQEALDCNRAHQCRVSAEDNDLLRKNLKPQ
jgi:hypothetical protein